MANRADNRRAMVAWFGRRWLRPRIHAWLDAPVHASLYGVSDHRRPTHNWRGMAEVARAGDDIDLLNAVHHAMVDFGILEDRPPWS